MPDSIPQVQCLFDKMVPVSELKPNPKNRNKHPSDQIERLASILEYQGWRYPIKVSKRSGFITSGHGRLLAAELRGWKQVPVNFQVYESTEQEYADVQADNAIASWAELDFSGINSDIGDLGPDFDVDLLGLKNFQIDIADKEPGCDEDAVPEKVEPRTKLGDIYQLGRHQLMCGDSTSIDAVERLMGGEKAELLWTDPPYGVSYADKNAFLNTISPSNRIQEPIKGDHQTPDQMNEFWFTVLSNAFTALSEKCSYYISSPQGGDLMMMMSIIRAGFQLKHMLIWVKNNHVLGRCDYNYKHEPMLYGWKESGTHEFYGGGRCKTSVWDFNKPMKNDLHPTMKPVELIEEAILNSSAKDAGVVDLFGGSGSTLIACEKTNRRCFMMEIDPKYCDVIVSRWEKYAGLKAELLDA